MILELVSGLALGYVCGSFPSGYFAGRMWGVDVRKHGSRRTGGTNVLRSAGWPAFLLTIFGDVFKGVLPVLIMRALFSPSEVGPAAAVIGVLLGNNWSFIIVLLAQNASNEAAARASGLYATLQDLFARAKGGAGVTATAGAALTLYWPPVLVLAVIGIGLLLLFRYASLSSITVAALYPIIMAFAVWQWNAPLIYLPMAFVVSLVVLYVHIPNMQRLRAGTESKFGQRLGKPK